VKGLAERVLGLAGGGWLAGDVWRMMYVLFD